MNLGDNIHFHVIKNKSPNNILCYSDVPSDWDLTELLHHKLQNQYSILDLAIYFKKYANFHVEYHNVMKISKEMYEKFYPLYTNIIGRGVASDLVTNNYSVIDFSLDQNWIYKMAEECESFKKIIKYVQQCCKFTTGFNTFWHLIVNYNNCEQVFYQDYELNDDTEVYHTLSIPLYKPRNSGAHFLYKENEDSKTYNKIENDKIVLFSNEIVHSGEKNNSSCPRIELVIILTNLDEDPNEIESFVKDFALSEEITLNDSEM